MDDALQGLSIGRDMYESARGSGGVPRAAAAAVQTVQWSPRAADHTTQIKTQKLLTSHEASISTPCSAGHYVERRSRRLLHRLCHS
jgi:hypothetical protein